MLSSPATNKETDSPRECRQGPKACRGPRRPAAGRAGAGGGEAEARQLPPGLEVLEEILVIACPPQHSCCEQPDLGGRGPLSEGGGPRGPQGYLGRGAGGGWHCGGFKNFLILDFSWVFHDIYNNNVEVLFVCFFVFLGGGEVICLREREGQGSLGGLRSDRLRAARGWSGRPGLPVFAGRTAVSPRVPRDTLGPGLFQRHGDHPKGSGKHSSVSSFVECLPRARHRSGKQGRGTEENRRKARPL